jgi:hypothetical protein
MYPVITRVLIGSMSLARLPRTVAFERSKPSFHFLLPLFVSSSQTCLSAILSVGVKHRSLRVSPSVVFYAATVTSFSPAQHKEMASNGTPLPC